MFQVLEKSKIMQNNEGKIYKRSTKISKKYYQTYIYSIGRLKWYNQT